MIEKSDTVLYRGCNRPELKNIKGIVNRRSGSGASALVDFNGHLAWVGISSLEKVEEEKVSGYASLIEELESEVTDLEKQYNDLMDKADKISEAIRYKRAAVSALKNLEKV